MLRGLLGRKSARCCCHCVTMSTRRNILSTCTFVPHPTYLLELTKAWQVPVHIKALFFRLTSALDSSDSEALKLPIDTLSMAALTNE